MLDGIVGTPNILAALRNYLNANKFSSGNAQDFYSAITLPSDMTSKTTVEKFMNTWLMQKNYPEVAISLSRTTTGTIVRFRQARFLLSEYIKEEAPLFEFPYGYKWKVYMQCAGGTYSANGGLAQNLQGSIDEFTFFLTGDNEQVEFSLRQYTWVKCNKNFNAYYITAYTEDVFNAYGWVLINAPSARFEFNFQLPCEFNF